MPVRWVVIGVPTKSFELPEVLAIYDTEEEAVRHLGHMPPSAPEVVGGENGFWLEWRSGEYKIVYALPEPRASEARKEKVVLETGGEES